MTKLSRSLSRLVLGVSVSLSLASHSRAALTPEEEEGRRIFTEETFGGNGRTCASCHVPTQNLRLTPANVQQRFATLAQTFDPLFIAESTMNLNTLTLNSVTTFPDGAILTGKSSSNATVRAKVLARKNDVTYLVYGGISPAFGPGTSVTDGANTAGVVQIVTGDLDQLESPAKMRGASKSPAFPQGRALILENPDGFDQPAVFRKVPHLQNLGGTSPFGFNNEIGSLEPFTIQAIRQHFPRSMARVEGVDFRLPTEEEQIALTAFLRSNTTVSDFDLGSRARTAIQRRGERAFLSIGCSGCHFDSLLGSRGEDPLPFATGVADQPINGPAPNGDALPKERPVDANGKSQRPISTAALMNVKHAAPFFHDNSAATLEDAIRFYTTDAFKNSAERQGQGIEATETQITEIAAFLRGLVKRTYAVELDGVDMTRGENVVEFGTLPVNGPTVTRTLTVRNISPSPVAFASPSCRTVIYSDRVSPDYTANCSQLHGVTLQPGQTRTVTVSFRPSNDGARRATLEMLTEDPTGVDLYGAGEVDGVVERFTQDNPNPVHLDRVLGNYHVDDGQLHIEKCQSCTAPNGTIAVHEFQLPINFDYTIKGIATSDNNDSNDFSVIFNFWGVDQYYYASFNERKDKSGLFRVLNGVVTRLAAFPSATPPGGPDAALHSIKIEKRDRRIRVFRGSTLFADVTDTTVPENTLVGGRAGVGSLNDAARFDDFRVMNR
jgi:cytochrome c peroxidase